MATQSEAIVPFIPRNQAMTDSVQVGTLDAGGVSKEIPIRAPKGETMQTLDDKILDMAHRKYADKTLRMFYFGPFGFDTGMASVYRTKSGPQKNKIWKRIIQKKVGKGVPIPNRPSLRKIIKKAYTTNGNGIIARGVSGNFSTPAGQGIVSSMVVPLVMKGVDALIGAIRKRRNKKKNQDKSTPPTETNNYPTGGAPIKSSQFHSGRDILRDIAQRSRFALYRIAEKMGVPLNKGLRIIDKIISRSVKESFGKGFSEEILNRRVGMTYGKKLTARELFGGLLDDNGMSNSPYDSPIRGQGIPDLLMALSNIDPREVESLPKIPKLLGKIASHMMKKLIKKGIYLEEDDPVFHMIATPVPDDGYGRAFVRGGGRVWDIIKAIGEKAFKFIKPIAADALRGIIEGRTRKATREGEDEDEERKYRKIRRDKELELEMKRKELEMKQKDFDLNELRKEKKKKKEEPERDIPAGKTEFSFGREGSPIPNIRERYQYSRPIGRKANKVLRLSKKI